MAGPVETQSFDFEGFHLDVAKRRLTGPDGPVEVPSRAFDVLVYLVAHAGDLLDKSSILKAVWPTAVVEEGNLSQCIFALRRALGDTANEPRFIATVPGRGYQFVAEVRGSAAETSKHETARPRSRRGLYVAVGLTLLAALVANRFWPTSTRARPAELAHAPMKASIAVLPFVDLSPAQDMEYFADGLADELMNSLSKAGGLRIIGRRSSFAFKGTKEDAKAIGEKLHVAMILDGIIRKDGDRIRVKVHLTRTLDGVLLWSEIYERPFDDVLDFQGSIAREVAATVAPALRDSQGSGKFGS